MWSLADSDKAGVARASERALVKAAQDGSTSAMEELFRRHWPNTHRAAYLIVRDVAAAEDIAQEAFLSALSALDRRRPFALGCTGSWSTGRLTGAGLARCAARWRRAERCSTRWAQLRRGTHRHPQRSAATT